MREQCLTSLAFDLLPCPTSSFLRSRREVFVGSRLAAYRRQPVCAEVVAEFAIRERLRDVAAVVVSVGTRKEAGDSVLPYNAHRGTQQSFGAVLILVHCLQELENGFDIGL